MTNPTCKLCNDFGFVYLVDEDPDRPDEIIKTRRDCWECGESASSLNLIKGKSNGQARRETPRCR